MSTFFVHFVLPLGHRIRWAFSLKTIVWAPFLWSLRSCCFLPSPTGRPIFSLPSGPFRCLFFLRLFARTSPVRCFFLLHHRLTYFLHTGAILYSSGASRSKILDRLTYVLNTRAIWYSSGASRSIILDRLTYFLHTGTILYSSGASRSKILDRLTYFLNTRAIWYSSGASRSIILDHRNLCFGSLFNSSMHIIIAFL